MLPSFMIKKLKIRNGTQQEKSEIDALESVISFRLDEDIRKLYLDGKLGIDSALNMQLVSSLNRLGNILDQIMKQNPKGKRQ